MSRITIRGERRIRPGCLDEFKLAAAAAMRLHREHDGPGTLQFDTYLDEANGVWIALESYVDSAALLAHLAVRTPELNEWVARLSDIGHSEVYGTPSPELMQLLARMGDGVTVYPQLERLEG